MDVVRELLATAEAVRKLDGRAISIDESQRLLDNRYVIVRNPRRGRSRQHAIARRLVVGRTDGGRALTLVVERTQDPGTWLLITGWEATPRERKLLGD
jgi:hypothetical protein